MIFKKTVLIQHDTQGLAASKHAINISYICSLISELRIHLEIPIHLKPKWGDEALFSYAD